MNSSEPAHSQAAVSQKQKGSGNMKMQKAFGVTAAAAAGVAVGAGVGFYASRLRTMASIRQESFSGTPYDLYSMHVSYSYDLDRIIERGLAGNQEGIDAILSEALPLLPVHMTAPDFGCSAFALSGEGQALMGRNYDFRLDTSAMLVHCAPADGYESIAFCALDNLGANNPLASVKTRFACLAAPFVCLDGVNEKGVSVAVLTLDSKPTCHNTDKPTISTSMTIRLVLDRAASTQEAVDLLRRYDMFASSGRDYHFYISDAAGNGCVVEYDCDDPARPMVVTPIRQVTNFFVIHKDKVAPFGKNGCYGHGRERYDAIEEVLDAAERKQVEPAEGACPEGDACGCVCGTAGASSAASMREAAWEALRAAAQEPNPEDVTSNTQWSIVFDNTNCAADVVLRRRWGNVHHATIHGGVR